MPIPLRAEAVDRDGLVVGLKFFSGTNVLGDGIRSATRTNLFELVWNNAPAGEHMLRAAAMDNLGAVGSSMMVKILVGATNQPPPPPQPVVTIRAADPFATEPCTAAVAPDPAVFVIFRDGPTNMSLQVFMRIGGTASNGVDYLTLPNSVTIPAGVRNAEIVVRPIPDTLTENTESVVARLVAPPFANPLPDAYLVGQPAEAVAYIRDCPELTNRPPMVKIVKPSQGMLFLAPANIGIQTETRDVDGYVWKVEFLANQGKIGEESKQFLVAPTNGTMIPYGMLWSNVPPGRYVLNARATDNDGLVSLSGPVEICVTTTNPPPPLTNLPPLLSIVAADPLAIEGTNCWAWPNPTNRWSGTTNTVTWDPGTCRSNYWFTNCGPKSATFVVRRAGNTNDDITARYIVRGTATNGVDYDKLSGLVTIPAGERRAEILIVPIADNVIEPIESILIALLPPEFVSNTPPAYLLSPQNRAGAIIVDSQNPRPRTAALIDRTFHIGADEVDGTWYRMESSTDMINWNPVCTNQVIQGSIHFVDPDAQDMQNQFYRAISVPEPPLDQQ